MLGNYLQDLQGIYGLKKTSCMWHLLFEEFFKSIGFIPLLLNLNVLVNRKVIISGLTLAVYVDDLLIVGEYEKYIIYVK